MKMHNYFLLNIKHGASQLYLGPKYNCKSYVDRAASEAGAAAEMAATRKEEKYVDLSARYFFEPIAVAVETLAVFNASAGVLLDDLGRSITSSSGKARETSFLYQRVSVLIQRYNAVLLRDSLPSTARTD